MAATHFLSFTTRENMFKGLGILVIFLIVLFFLYRFVRFACKRFILAVKLKRACKSKGATLTGTSPLWMFGRRNASPCDVYITTTKTVYAVKLFGVAGRRSQLIFGKNRTYSIRSRWLPDIGPTPIPEYNFRYGFRYEWELKTPRKILLLSPVCIGVFREENAKKNTYMNPHIGIFKEEGAKKTAPINPHEQLFGMELHTMTSLLRMIGEE